MKILPRIKPRIGFKFRNDYLRATFTIVGEDFEDGQETWITTPSIIDDKILGNCTKKSLEWYLEYNGEIHLVI